MDRDTQIHFSGYGDFEVRQTTPEEREKAKKKKTSTQSVDRYREKYFEYYDDVKDKSLKNQDW